MKATLKTLRRTQFGNPVLRQQARRLVESEIASESIQSLIANMRHTLKVKKYGVGLAAPQVGKSIALSVIGIKPTPTRPNLPVVNEVLINPEIVKTYGRKQPLWEGCISFGGTRDFPYAQVPRYLKVRVRWLDEMGKQHERDVEGITAHVMQHEIDHLNGVLFVDHVVDPKSYVTISEYRKRFQAVD